MIITPQQNLIHVDDQRFKVCNEEYCSCVIAVVFFRPVATGKRGMLCDESMMNQWKD